MERIPGTQVICPAKFEDMHSRMGMKQASAKQRSIIQRNATAEIIVTYGPGAQANPEARAAFDFALAIWSEEIVSSVPIRISAEFANLGPGVLASAGPTTLVRNFPGAPQQDVFYPIALANSLAGEDLAPDTEFDLVVNLGNGIPWYFGTDGNTPAGLFDFVSVALHEAGHGLGFIDGGNVSGGVGNINNGGDPFVFDTFVVDGNNNSVLDLPNPSIDLGVFYTSGDVFVNGNFAVAANNGTNPELFAPNPFQGGSSIAHWDEATFPAGDSNSLMTPQIGSAESNFDIGDITRGFFRDMGWVLAEQAPITIVPNQISDVLNVDETINEEISITNTSENPVNITINPSSNALLINSISNSNFTIPAGETTTFTVELSTVDVNKGIYEESIEILIEGFEEAVNIPVNIRVIDGTEAPVLVINPTSFSETLQKLQVVTRDLVIQNTGDDTLTYNITVNDSLLNTVNTRTAKTNDFIIKNGFKTATRATNFNPLQNPIIKLLSIDNTFNRLATNLFAADFENYTIGDLNGQFGWQTSPNTWEVTTENPATGANAIQLQGDGSATRALAFTPSIAAGSEPFMIASADINIQGSGVTWEFIPQSNTAELVNTRVRFNPDNTIDIFDSDIGDFTRIDRTTPSGYFNIRIVIDRDDAALTIFFDDELIYSGRAAANQIEQIVLLSEMETATSTMNVDNIEIIDGDANAFFLSVSPTSGSVNFGSETTLDVKFDTRALEAGEYSATINISSNDPRNAKIDIPVALTVLSPPTITVNPDSLSTAINVQTDNPATKTEIFTITNTGQANLDFTSVIGNISFTPPSNSNTILGSLDLSKYGVSNNVNHELKRASTSGNNLSSLKKKALKNSAPIIDSIAYDAGINFPDDFVGFNNGTALTTAVKFDVDRNFTLTAIRNGYRTELSADPIILEIYQGGTTPNDGTLLLSQTITKTSADGVFDIETLNQAFSFSNGDSFWVVHKYPQDINFPQGVNDGAPVRPNTYFISDDGGATFSTVDFVFLTRALNTQTNNSITLNPSEGSIAPGASVDVSVTFDATDLSNGNYASDILISSNDPVNPTTTVTTSLDVSGQTSFIELSDEFILFNNVFIGNDSERIITLSNSGLSQINVSSISSDNVAFSVTPSSTTIAAGESIDITVKFTPNITGNINGIITVDSDASNASSLQIIVNGVGVEPPIAVLDPANVSETVDSGNTVDTQIALKNEGKAPLFFSFPDLAVAAALAKPDVKLNDTKILNFSNFSNQKGAKDDRIGSKVLYSLGTDNGFGYSWIDSDENGGPIYNFVDISGTGTEITADLGGDGSLGIPLQFPFEFYGNTYTNATVNANGFISFDESSTLTFVNSQIPVDNGVNNMIAGLWDDLEPQNFNGTVHYQTIDDAFIVQWTNASVFLGSENETVTFQIVLHSDGNIDVFYEDVETASFLNSATVGIENADGTDGAQVVFNSDYIKNRLALRFVKPDVALTPFISNVTPISGVVPAGGSRNLTVTSDATNLNDGVYFDELVVSSNSPDTSTSTSLIELTVKGFPRIEVPRDSITFEPIFVGLESSTTFLIENTGSKTLEYNLSNQNSDFTVTATNTSIIPGASQSITVNFTPTSVGSITDNLLITSNDAFGNQSITIPLSGIGVDPPVINVTPEEFNLTLKREKTTTEIITIENTGGSTLNYSLVKTPFSTNLTNNTRTVGYSKIEYEEQIITKEQTDNRIGPKFLNASGGPGTFGYIWTDNNSGGPAYNFIDISSTGTLANVGADGDETVNLPFTFNFFGEDQNNVIIAANGFLSFSPITASFGAFLNQQIPSTENPNFLIAGLWDDLEPQDGDGVFYQAFEDYFIVQYENVPGFGSSPIKTPVTFQIILFKDGSIKMQYKNVDSEISTSSTVGLEGPNGESGLQVIFNTEFLTNELAITFTPPIMGSVAPGASIEVPVAFSAEGLEANTTYNSNIIISSNDPANSEVTVPVTLNVLDSPEIVSFMLIDATTNTEVGIINDGDIIDLNDYNGFNNFSIIANQGTLDIASVVFDFNEETAFNTENRAPFSLKGDFNGTNFRGVAFNLGTNTVSATPFEEKNGDGDSGIPLTINFEIIDSNPPTVTDFILINATNNSIIGPLNEGDTIDLADFRRNNFSVVANTSGSRVESVIFDFNDRTNFNTESNVPYSLNGDLTFRRTNYFGVPFSIGTQTITATPYRNNNGQGDNGTPVTITFEVIDSDAPLVTSFTLIDAVTNQLLGPLNEGDTINIANFGANRFSVLANTEGADTRSVVFEFNNRNRFNVENFAPYSLKGDFAGNFNGIKFPIGTNTITATPYKRIFGKGKPGSGISVTFTVINDNSSTDQMVNGQISPNPVRDIATVTLKENNNFKDIANMNLKVSIHTLSGFTMKQPVLFSLNEQQKGQVNVGSLPTGIYILRVTDTNDQIISRIKLIKK
ncbi:Ig-like domain-containing protein [Tenacibaculum jejuense]|uniref:Choice-of-anchor D domain-containing protein n=1 Tax=Tenacibaculum jejuense TaxID=584609 RepID=A0A238UCI6_9FLAO|nr:choice-of-anchor D domain-containing protein [Tenacibaculum jejuense]SNR16278.1 Protein of unknown function precursor containing a C-terminal secretion signal [Tenacibaculum jejuense]